VKAKVSNPSPFFPFDEDYRNEDDWSADEKCPCCKLEYSVHTGAEAIYCARKIIRQAVSKSRFLQ